MWWTLKAMGARNVGILDGGFQAYKHSGLPVHTDKDALAAPTPARFNAQLNTALIKTWHDVRANIGTKACTLLDARNAGRFAGTSPEPRKGLAGGHIPGSANIPFDALLDSKTGLYKSDEQLRALFAAAGVDEKRPVIASCGSGVTACVLLYGLHLLGRKDIALYDGSWSEWGLPALKLPVATGAGAKQA